MTATTDDNNFKSQFQRPETPESFGSEDTRDIRKGLGSITRSLGDIIHNTAAMPILQSGFKEDIKGAIGVGFLGPMYGVLGQIAEFGPLKDGLGKLYNLSLRGFTWMKKELYTLLWFSFRGIRAALSKVSGFAGGMWKWFAAGGLVSGLIKALKFGILPLLGGALVAKDAYYGYQKEGVAGAIGYGLGGQGSIGTRMLTGAAKGALLGTLFGPLGTLIGAGVGTLLGAIGGERITEGLKITGRTIKKGYDWAYRNIFKPLGKDFAETWHSWGDALGSGYKWFKSSVWDPTIGFFKKLWNDPGKVLLDGYNWFKNSVWNPVTGFLKDMWNHPGEMAYKGYTWFKNSVWTPVTGFLKDMWNSPGDVTSKGYTWFKNSVWNPVTGFLKDMWNSPGETLKSSYEWYKSTIHEPFTKFMGSLFDFVGQFIPGYRTFKEAWSQYSTWISGMFDSIGESITSTKDWIKEHMSLESWMKPIRENLIAIKDYIVNWPRKIYDEIKTSIFSRESIVSKEAKEQANRISTPIPPPSLKEETPILSKSEEKAYWQSEIDAINQLTNSVNKLVKVQETQAGQQTTEGTRRNLTFRELKKVLDDIPLVLDDAGSLLINSGVR